MRTRSIISLVVLAGCFETPQLQIQVTRTDTGFSPGLVVEDPNGMNPSTAAGVNTGDVFATDKTTHQLVTVFVTTVAPIVVRVDPGNGGAQVTPALVCFQVPLVAEQTLQRTLIIDTYNTTDEGVIWGCPGTSCDTEKLVTCP